MTIEELLRDARTTWGDTPMSLENITIALGVVYGDVCRQARLSQEGSMPNKTELQKELGNVIYSAIRWCDDLGFAPAECIELAKSAQARYAASLKKSH